MWSGKFFYQQHSGKRANSSAVAVLVVAESDDSISEEATLSETREAERLISSRTVCRIMASITEWYVKMAVFKRTCTTREHNSREKTGDDPKLKLDCD